MRITKEKTVGLIIDMQERLFPVMHNKEKLLRNCEILIQGLVELDVPLLVSQQYTKGLGETLPEVQKVIPGFSYIDKTNFSCFDIAEIREKLKQLNAQNIIICGIESHICVLQTAVDMKAAGLNPVVVMDCVSSRTSQNVEMVKERCRYEGIMMMSYESVLFELLCAAVTPAFKKISKLIR